MTKMQEFDKMVPTEYSAATDDILSGFKRDYEVTLDGRSCAVPHCSESYEVPIILENYRMIGVPQQ